MNSLDSISEEDILNALSSKQSDDNSSVLDSEYSESNPEISEDDIQNALSDKSGYRESLKPYIASLASGLIGSPNAILQLPKALVNDINTAYTGKNDLEENLSKSGKRALNFLDTVASYLPNSSDIRQKLTGEENPDFINRLLIGAGSGAPFGPLGSGIGAGFQLLDEILNASQASPRTQSIVRLGANVVPVKVKGFTPTKRQAPVYNFLKENGLTDRQIAPILNDKSFINNTARKIAKKTGKTEAALADTNAALGGIFEKLKEDQQSKVVPDQLLRSEIENSLNEKLMELPSDKRRRIQQDVNDYYNSARSASDAINLYRDINETFSEKNANIQSLKEPLLQQLDTTVPELAANFRILNEIYSNFADVRQSLKPTTLGAWLEQSLPYRILGGILTGNPFLLKEAIGEAAVKTLAREMIINPKLKNLSKRLSIAIEKKSPGFAAAAQKQLSDELRKSSPEVADKLEELDITKAFEGQ